MGFGVFAPVVLLDPPFDSPLWPLEEPLEEPLDEPPKKPKNPPFEGVLESNLPPP